jgi:Flp pilus assembly protein TadG
MTRYLSPRVRARLRDAKGTSAVETALILPLLLLLTFSVIDFGLVFYAYLALENGASQATRLGVTGNVLDDPLHPGTPLSRDASIKLAMRNATPTLTIDDSAFTFTNMPAAGGAWTAGSGGPSDIEKVEISYTWKFFNPMMAAFFTNGQMVIKVDSVMKNEGSFQ